MLEALRRRRERQLALELVVEAETAADIQELKREKRKVQLDMSRGILFFDAYCKRIDALIASAKSTVVEIRNGASTACLPAKK